jgi:hypothetical protein
MTSSEIVTPYACIQPLIQMFISYFLILFSICFDFTDHIRWEENSPYVFPRDLAWVDRVSTTAFPLSDWPIPSVHGRKKQIKCLLAHPHPISWPGKQKGTAGAPSPVIGQVNTDRLKNILRIFFVPLLSRSLSLLMCLSRLPSAIQLPTREQQPSFPPSNTHARTQWK